MTDQSKCREQSGQNKPQKKNKNSKMKATDCTEPKTSKHIGDAAKTGAPSSRRRKKQKLPASYASGEQLEKPMVTSKMACKILNCHITTLNYRVKRGYITPIVIRGMRYFLLEDVESLRRYNPVKTKPHYTRRASVVNSAPSLWQRIKALFV